ncbi:hypothetical protein R1flu_023372 [Riccia fluitans]|uniref:Uncharacterized protein n=1 Tax=Riccia fluitans TaxID=41844 RepID=A0ABD1XSD0_9MARC
MDGKLVEPFDLDELERPRKIVRNNPSKRRPNQTAPTAATNGSSLPFFENDVPLLPNVGAEAPISRKGKEKMTMQPENAFKDEACKELRELKEAITMSRREAKAIARSQRRQLLISINHLPVQAIT